MKRIIFLLFLGVIGFNLTVAAQKAITTVHLYDIKNASLEKAYIKSIKEVNAIIKEIGYPNNYYSFYKIKDSDTTKTYRACTLGHWTSDEVYKIIHENAKFKAWGEKQKDNNAVFIEGQLYRRMYEVN
jgi:hypothetical protein